MQVVHPQLAQVVCPQLAQVVCPQLAQVVCPQLAQVVCPQLAQVAWLAQAAWLVQAAQPLTQATAADRLYRFRPSLWWERPECPGLGDSPDVGCLGFLQFIGSV